MDVVRPRLKVPEIPLDSPFAIQRGDYVLLDNGYDMFWTQIADVKSKGYYDGIVFTRLRGKFSYSFGDLIRFHQRHVSYVHTLP